MNRKNVLVFLFFFVFLVAGPGIFGKEKGIVEIGDIKMHYTDTGTGTVSWFSFPDGL